MDALFFIAIPTDPVLEESTHFHWVKHTDSKSSYGYDTLSDLKALCSESHFIAVVSGTKVFETQSELKIKNRKQLEQALRYDLEEQLATEVDDLHFAYQATADKTLEVSVINRQYLESILHFLLEHSITPQSLVSETSLLKQAPKTWLIIANEQQLLLKAEQNTYAIDSENLDLSLSCLKQDIPTSIPVYSTKKLSLTSNQTQFNYQIQPHCLTQLCQYYSSDTPVLNLLQGSFQVKTPKSWRLLIGSAIISLALLLAITAYQGYQSHLLQQQDSDLKQQINTLYKKTFPKARRIINPVSQMRTQLKQRQSTLGNQGDFIPLLAKVSRVLRKQAKLQLMSLDYQTNNLTIRLETDNLSQLEALKNTLNQNDLQVTLSDINKENNRVLAQLTIKGAI